MRKIKISKKDFEFFKSWACNKCRFNKECDKTIVSCKVIEKEVEGKYE